MDKKGSHDLFGPVNKIYCASYDRAMALYLACLRVQPVSCFTSVFQAKASLSCCAMGHATLDTCPAAPEVHVLPGLRLATLLSLGLTLLEVSCFLTLL